MKISELISELEDTLALHGDKEVYVYDVFGKLEQSTEVIETGKSKEENCVIAII